MEVDALVETFNAHGHRSEALHGGMLQRQRDHVMGLFRSQKADLLIATDVAARGLDITHISHVVNYDVPASPEVYLHRIGRTGRAGREGVAITLAEPREHRLLRVIEQFTRTKIEVATVPTVADLRARQLDITRASLRERLLAKDFDDVRVVVESLAEEFDIVDIAAAAVKMVRAATAEGSDQELREIPAAPLLGGNDPRDAGVGTATGRKGGRAVKGPRVRAREHRGPQDRARSEDPATPLRRRNHGLRADGRSAKATGRFPPTGRPFGCTSAPGGRPASGPAIWLARLPVKPVSSRACSGRFRLAIVRRISRSRTPSPTTSSRR